MMRPELNPILPFVIASATAVVALWLFIVVKVDLRRAARRREQDTKDILGACQKLQETIDEMRRQPTPSLAPAPEALPQGPAAAMSRRAQVLRMSRRGDRPDQIASSLGMTANEVALVLKVAALQQANTVSAAAAGG